MKDDPIQLRIVLLLLTFVQTAAVYFAVVTIWVPDRLKAPLEFLRAGLPIAPVSAWLFGFSESVQPALPFHHQIALAVCGAHFFAGFALIWSSRYRPKIHFRWTLFSVTVWAMMFGWAIFVIVAMTNPFIVVLQQMRLATPPATVFTPANITLVTWLVLLAAGIGVICRRDSKRARAKTGDV